MAETQNVALLSWWILLRTLVKPLSLTIFSLPRSRRQEPGVWPETEVSNILTHPGSWDGILSSKCFSEYNTFILTALLQYIFHVVVFIHIKMKRLKMKEFIFLQMQTLIFCFNHFATCKTAFSVFFSFSHVLQWAGFPAGASCII